MKKCVKLVAGAVLFGVLSSSVFQGTNYFASVYGTGHGTVGQESTAGGQETGNSPLTTVAAQTGNEIAGVSGVAEAVLPSIVAIDVSDFGTAGLFRQDVSERRERERFGDHFQRGLGLHLCGDK